MSEEKPCSCPRCKGSETSKWIKFFRWLIPILIDIAIHLLVHFGGGHCML
jgi:hypothetical protein